MSALRVLELVQIGEIEMLLDTIIGDLHGKEKDLLLNESKEKIATREKALARAKEIKAELKINQIFCIFLYFILDDLNNIYTYLSQ